MNAAEAYETVPEAYLLAKHLCDVRAPINLAVIEPELPRFERLAEITSQVRTGALERIRIMEEREALLAERMKLISEIAASSGVEERVLLGLR